MSGSSLRRLLLIAGGIVAVVLSVIGIFVPLLPTTPLLLLAAACFVRSSDRLYTWLIQNKWFGPYIRHYREYRAVTLRTKVVTVVLLWAAMGYTVVRVAHAWWLRVLLGMIALGVTVHVLRLKTLTREMLSADPER